MLELRWLKGKWKFGKFKLQYRDITHPQLRLWHDVLTEEEVKPEVSPEMLRKAGMANSRPARPPEKSLEERLRSEGSIFQNLKITHINGKEFYERMAEIAESWAKEKYGDK